MKQKMVIKLQLNDQKGRSKALQIVVGISGVESAALQGADKDEIVVTGDGVDAVVLTTALRNSKSKSIGYAELVSVGENKKEEEKKETKNEAVVYPTPTWTCYAQYPQNRQMVYEHPTQDNCSIM
ncbi:disease resistance protein Pik-1-like [Cornus florida]|uniref:disease resistance protein Pik-1-like n=1 Tax=Cornus florida TaxID=4283 RepID=UPI00289CAC5B|nr:disease resistance protein Pik-1-like [Cornus florida]